MVDVEATITGIGMIPADVVIPEIVILMDETEMTEEEDLPGFQPRIMKSHLDQVMPRSMTGPIQMTVTAVMNT